MIFRFGSDVVDRDDNKVGQLNRIVYHPTTQQVADLVVEDGPFGVGEVVIPIGSVQAADENVVVLELSEEQIRSLDAFDEDRNLAPPPNAANIAEDEVTDPVDVADVPAIGAATGVESIAFTPILQETVNLPPDEQVLDGQTEVWATDGKVGHIARLHVSDQTDRMESLHVEKGFIFTHDVEVPAGSVDTVQNGRVMLQVEQSALKAASDD